MSALGYSVWALLGLAAGALCAASHRPGSALSRPGEMVQRLAARPFVRMTLVLAVAWTGWHLFAR